MGNGFGMGLRLSINLRSRPNKYFLEHLTTTQGKFCLLTLSALKPLGSDQAGLGQSASVVGGGILNTAIGVEQQVGRGGADATRLRKEPLK